MNTKPSSPRSQRKQLGPSQYRKTVLKNGLRIVSESIPHVRSVSLGVWANVGSRDETPEQNGISHFLEHMVFKGTTHRSTEDIAQREVTLPLYPDLKFEEIDYIADVIKNFVAS